MTTTQIEKAAMWLAEEREYPAEVLLVIQQKFGLTPAQAAQALTLARQYMINRRSFG